MKIKSKLDKKEAQKTIKEGIDLVISPLAPERQAKAITQQSGQRARVEEKKQSSGAGSAAAMDL
jgi:hypothetical protein